MKLSALASQILDRRRENSSSGPRVAVDGMREISTAIALEKRGLGRFEHVKQELRLPGDRRLVSHGGHFYPSL